MISASRNNTVTVFYFSVNTQQVSDKKEVVPSFFTQERKEISLGAEQPISLEFSDDNKSFLVGTAQSQFKFELPDLKKKNLLQESDE